LRLKILKKLRTASLNSEFTGSYKKSVSPKTFDLLRLSCGVLNWTTKWFLFLH